VSLAISVVVPTYNRGAEILPTIESLLASDLPQGAAAELIVVDDGSKPERYHKLDTVAVPSHWTLQQVHKENGGPASARNLGLASAKGEIVLFVDDDIVVPPTLVSDHIRAHRLNPRAVIFGRYPFRPPQNTEESLVQNYLNDEGFDCFKDAHEPYVSTTLVASGHISVERADFSKSLYDSNTRIPVAEEMELSARLKRIGYKVLIAPQIVAVHNRPSDIAYICRNRYTHGLGCGESRVKVSASELDEIAQMIARLDPPGHWLNLQESHKHVKTLASTRPVKYLSLRMAQALSWHFVPKSVLFKCYRLAITSHFVAGYRDGLAIFRKPSTENTTS